VLVSAGVVQAAAKVYNASYAPVAQLDQSIWLRTRGSGVRVSPGAPFFKESIIPAGHVLIRSMLVSFIAFRLALTSFFTNAMGIGFPFGKLTMAFVVA
jgi:hypothetical protein